MTKSLVLASDSKTACIGGAISEEINMCGIVGTVTKPETRSALALYDALLMIQKEKVGAFPVVDDEGNPKPDDTGHVNPR